jgi:GPH family glycoside/pentoside/hexuronide:cation symporter
MGGIFLISWIWDAISDPIAGYLSDRTRTTLGRRRPWMLAAALPVGVAFLFLWNPPARLDAGALTLWVAGFLLLVYTALTAFLIPHDALGAELTSDYRDRTRVYGWKRGLFGVGALGAMGGVFLLTRAETTDAARQTAFYLSLAAASLAVALFAFAGTRLRERPEYRDRGGRHPYRAIRDVFRNPHARLLLSVFFIQQTGVVALSLTTSYYTDYVLGDATATAPILVVFLLSGTLSIPIWIRISATFEKKTLMLAAMAVIGPVMGTMFFQGRGDIVNLVVLAGVAGLASGGTDTVFPSIQADVIDYDEYQTGERKEGTYFATWAFAAKSAAGVVAIGVGFVLDAVGYEPNVEQTETVKIAIRGMFAGFPFLCYVAGIALFLRFGLNAERHAEIRLALDDRANAARESRS